MNHGTGMGLAETFGVARRRSALPRIPEQKVPEDRRPPRVPLDERLRAVAAVNRAIVDGGPSDDLLRLIAHRTRRLVGAPLALVLLPEESGQLSVRAADTDDGEVLPDSGRAGHAALARSGLHTVTPDAAPCGAHAPSTTPPSRVSARSVTAMASGPPKSSNGCSVSRSWVSVPVHEVNRGFP